MVGYSKAKLRRVAGLLFPRVRRSFAELFDAPQDLELAHGAPQHVCTHHARPARHREDRAGQPEEARRRALAVDAYSLLRRLGKSEKPALEAQGTIEYLMDSFDKMNIGARDDKKWELPHPDAAKMLRSALGNWARQALQRSEAAQQLSLTTNVNKAEGEAQALLTQLNDQLSLPLIDINAFVEEIEAKPEKKEKPMEMDTDVQRHRTAVGDHRLVRSRWC